MHLNDTYCVLTSEIVHVNELKSYQQTLDVTLIRSVSRRFRGSAVTSPVLILSVSPIGLELNNNTSLMRRRKLTKGFNYTNGLPIISAPVSD